MDVRAIAPVTSKLRALTEAAVRVPVVVMSEVCASIAAVINGW
jgi:hypothetical protein